MAHRLVSGWLTLRVIRRAEIASDVLLLELAQVGGGPLPEWEPGAHVELRLPSGLTRQYSLCGDQSDLSSYTVCVLREVNGRGGSAEIHREVRLGTELAARSPGNHFPLIDAKEYLLIAGGIGITPIKAMVEALQRRGAEWQLVYGGRSLSSMAFVDELRALGAERVRVVAQDTDGMIDIAASLADVRAGTQIYCCGPAGLLDAVHTACAAAGIADRLRVERFTAAEGGSTSPAQDDVFEVELATSGVTVRVAAGQSILAAVQAVRDDIDFSCAEGYCGSCETRVIGGQPDHRGTLMSPAEHDEVGTMLICVGRSRTPRLILDL